MACQVFNLELLRKESWSWQEEAFHEFRLST
jgi:hypothetical protein